MLTAKSSVQGLAKKAKTPSKDGSKADLAWCLCLDQEGGEGTTATVLRTQRCKWRSLSCRRSSCICPHQSHWSNLCQRSLLNLPTWSFPELPVQLLHVPLAKPSVQPLPKVVAQPTNLVVPRAANAALAYALSKAIGPTSARGRCSTYQLGRSPSCQRSSYMRPRQSRWSNLCQRLLLNLPTWLFPELPTKLLHTPLAKSSVQPLHHPSVTKCIAR